MQITLQPMTPALLDAEDQGTDALFKALGLPATTDWPPAFHDAQIRTVMRRYLADQPAGTPFAGYYILAHGCPAGTCGFKGPPNAQGMVEIGYSVIASLQRQGIAKAAVKHLLAIAFADPRVATITAQTIPGLTASQRTAESCGFTLTDRRPDADHGEILTYTCRRA